jgi:hypothetical protein
MVCRARCSCRPPPRLRRWRTTWPEEACTGAAPGRGPGQHARAGPVEAPIIRGPRVDRAQGPCRRRLDPAIDRRVHHRSVPDGWLRTTRDCGDPRHRGARARGAGARGLHGARPACPDLQRRYAAADRRALAVPRCLRASASRRAASIRARRSGGAQGNRQSANHTDRMNCAWCPRCHFQILLLAPDTSSKVDSRLAGPRGALLHLAITALDVLHQSSERPRRCSGLITLSTSYSRPDVKRLHFAIPRRRLRPRCNSALDRPPARAAGTALDDHCRRRRLRSARRNLTFGERDDDA